MMSAINGMLLAISSSPAASIVAKVTVIMALALFAAWVARGSRAAVRYALQAAAFGVTLLLPVASVLLPPVHLGVPVAAENRVSPARPPVSGGDQSPAVLMLDNPEARVTSASQSSRISLSYLLLAGWIAGAAIFLVPLVTGLWRIRLLRRSGLPWPHGESLARKIALEAGVHRRVEVLLHEGVPGPMTCGVVHPAVILPRDAESWNEGDLNRAIVHELEHVRRGDSASRSLARAICAVYWFHPLVWIAWRKLVLEAERSCDDAVLQRSEAIAYAQQLVGLAERLSVTRRTPMVAMADRSDLATRVEAVLNARQQRGRAGMLALVLACAAAVVLVIAVSPLTLVAAPLRDALAPSTSTLRSDAGYSHPAAPSLPSKPHTRPDPSRLIAQAQTAQAQTAQAQTAQAALPAQAPQTPAAATPSRLLTLFFDANSLDAQTLVRARDAAIKFVQTEAIPSDRIAVMMYTSKLNVLTDFTNNQDSILAALGMISTADAVNTGTDNPVGGPEFNIFMVDRQLAALEDAVKLLGAVPEKKALIYFAKGIQGGGVDNQAQLRATINAAVSASVSIWPINVDASGDSPVFRPLRRFGAN